MANEKKFNVMAEGEGRLDILNRISMLYSQRHIAVQSLTFAPLGNGESRYSLCAVTDENTIRQVVSQMSRIIDIHKVVWSEASAAQQQWI